MGWRAWNDQNCGFATAQEGGLPGLYRRQRPARMAFSHAQPDNALGFFVLKNSNPFRSCGNSAHKGEEGAIRLIASHGLLRCCCGGWTARRRKNWPLPCSG